MKRIWKKLASSLSKLYSENLAVLVSLFFLFIVCKTPCWLFQFLLLNLCWLSLFLKVITLDFWHYFNVFDDGPSFFCHVWFNWCYWGFNLSFNLWRRFYVCKRCDWNGSKISEIFLLSKVMMLIAVFFDERIFILNKWADFTGYERISVC